MQLVGASESERYSRWRELVAALRTATLALLAAVAFAVAGATFSFWAFLPAAFALLFALVEGVLVWRKVLSESGEQLDALLKGPPVRASDANAHEYGVDVEALPPGSSWRYVSRDFEHELAAAIRNALADQGPRLVMLSGETKAGKTRAAFQALQMPELAHAWLLEPRDGASVAGLLQPGALPRDWRTVVIWLDDIERFASVDAAGLDVSALRGPRCDRPLVLLATEGGRGQTRYANASELADPVTQLRALAAQIEVPVALTDAELGEVRSSYRDALATEIESVGLGRRMVAAEEVKHKLTTGCHAPGDRERCREGMAVLRAAIDWRRAGAQSSLSRAQLDERYRRYLPDDLDPSDALLEAGIAWARRPLPNTEISLLRKAKDDPECFEPYDLAVQVAAHVWTPVDGPSLTDLLAAASPSDQFTMGIVAYEGGNPRMATQLFARAQRSNDRGLASNAGFNLGLVLEELGRLAEAEAAYRQADQLGSAIGACNLGLLLQAQGRIEEAEAAYHRADERGDAIGAYNLGVLLDQLGRGDEAIAAYRRSGARGSALGAYNLGVQLKERNKLKQAIAAYRRADELGDADGANGLGNLLQQRKRLDEAQAAFRRADARDHAAGAYNLGVLLQRQGRLGEAEAAWRRADQRGHAAAAYNLGVLLQQRGRTQEADAAFRRAKQRGQTAPH